MAQVGCNLLHDSDNRLMLQQLYADDICSFKSDPSIIGTVEVSDVLWLPYEKPVV